MPTGRLRLSSFPSVVRLVFPPVLTRLRARFPDLVVEVEDLEGEQSLDALRLGHADVAVIDDLTWSAASHRSGIRVTELFGIPLVVVFPSGHRFGEKHVVAWADLAGEAQVTEQPSSLFARSVSDECRRAGFEPRVRARVHDAAAVLALVEAGDLVTVLPELQVLGQGHAVEWRPLEPTVERRLLAATRVGQHGLPALGAVLEELSTSTATVHRR
jgi:DNA-binding transcriptional LysR family regulator